MKYIRFKKLVKINTEMNKSCYILYTGDSAVATGWCIRVKHKACNELIRSVKWITLWTGRSVICQRPSMTVAHKRQQCSIHYDTCEHVKL